MKLFPPLNQEKISLFSESFDDMIGYENVIGKLRQTANFLRNADKPFFKDIQYHNGIMLTGSSSMGKKSLAEALAKEAGGLIYYTSGADLYANEGNIRNALLLTAVCKFWVLPKFLIDYLPENLKDTASSWSIFPKPCIVFINDIDKIEIDRKCENDSKASSKFLSKMEKLTAINKRIFFVGATEKPGQLSAEFFKPEKFSKLITVKLPNKKERKEVIEQELNSGNLNDWADKMQGWSVEEIKNTLNEAKLRSKYKILLPDMALKSF